MDCEVQESVDIQTESEVMGMKTKCKYCEKDFSSARARNAHELFKCEKKPPKDSKPEESGGHECRFRLLSSSSYSERRAMQDGFKKICKECGDIE